MAHLLRIGLYQIAFMKKADYHVVNETVEYIKKEKGKEAASFANAVLRRFIREQLPSGDLPEEAINRSFPGWLVKKWEHRFGASDTKRLLSILNQIPVFGLRVDTSRIARSEAMKRLCEEGIETIEGRFSESALSVDKLGPVLKSRLFSEGLVYIQDEMSQLAGIAVNLESGQYILDACAGMGTKSRHIRDSCKSAFVISMDNEIKRIRFFADRSTILLGDALRSPFKQNSFDTILLDAPCSSLGILRKHPEIKWRRQEQDIPAFGYYQLSLLKALWDLIVPGGCLIYSVCSFEPEETTNIIERFSEQQQFILENPLPFLFNKEYFLSLPHETGTDGFFIAKMRKT